MNFYDALLDDFYQQDDLEEDIEKHNELNPKLFDGDKLKPEVADKINQIVDLFLNDLKEDNIKINVDDIILVGSNVSYNYTKDSDLDIHVIADTKKLHCPDNLYPLLYGAYKSLFNKKLDIDFYGIPVEIYVETNATPLRSNGIYSVKDNKWIKFPKQADIPDIDTEKLEELIKPFEERYNEILKNPTVKDIDKWITDIYDHRQKGMSGDGEWDYNNLLFKEIRNRGYLDKLKELKNEVLSKELSLESIQIKQPEPRLNELFDHKKLVDCKQKIMQTTRIQPVVDCYGNFSLYNIKEQDVDNIVKKLKQLNIIANVHKTASGKYDFSHINFVTKQPSRYFTIQGKLC